MVSDERAPTSIAGMKVSLELTIFRRKLLCKEIHSYSNYLLNERYMILDASLEPEIPSGRSVAFMNGGRFSSHDKIFIL
ncbi:MAG: hypothetical protein ACP5HH_03965 [Fervidicoccaceae archaeon]